MAMANIGAFLVIIAVSASTVYAYPDKPLSTSTNRFPNILAPLKSLFSKREPHQHQQHYKEQQQHATPVAIPVQFVPQPDMSGAESGASSEFNLTPRPIPIPAEGDLNAFDSASPSPQFSLSRPMPMRFTMRNPFRRPRRPRPVMQGGSQQGFQQGGQEDQPGIGSAGGGGSDGGGRPHNPYGYPVEHNTEEQFNNDLGDGKPRPAYGHYGNRGPEVGQSFQQPQQQQFPASYGGSPARRPMRSRPFYSGGGSNNNNNGSPSNSGVFPYPSVIRGSGGGRKPFRPSRPDASSYEGGNQFGGGGGFGQGGFRGGNPDFQQAEEVIYGQGGGGGGRGSRPYSHQSFSGANSEPEIITLDDLQNQGFGNDDYPPQSGRPMRGGRYPMKMNQGGQGPSNSYTRPVPSYSHPQHEEGMVHRRPKGGRIYQSRPLRSPGGRLNPYSHFASNSDEVPAYKKPKAVPVSVESNEEILYGKPMAMSSTTHASSSTGKELPTSTYRPPEYSSQRSVSTSKKPPYVKPYLLKATKNPNYKKSSTISSPVIIDSATGELQQSATSFGGGGDIGASELAGGNGDRILFHVSGHKGPYSYRWGYDTGKGYNRMFRFEEKDEAGHVRGKYGYQDKHGKMNVVNYEAHPDAGYHQEPTNY